MCVDWTESAKDKGRLMLRKLLFIVCVLILFAYTPMGRKLSRLIDDGVGETLMIRYRLAEITESQYPDGH